MGALPGFIPLVGENPALCGLGGGFRGSSHLSFILLREAG